MLFFLSLLDKIKVGGDSCLLRHFAKINAKHKPAFQKQSVRIQRQKQIPTDLYWEMMMNQLVDLDEERLHALEILIRQKERVARAYNKKVKGKAFSNDDLVWKVILPMDRKNKLLGKWSPHWEGPFRVIQTFTNNAYEIEELAEDRRVLKINGKHLKKYKPKLRQSSKVVK